jgi:hypothetical protein
MREERIAIAMMIITTRQGFKARATAFVRLIVLVILNKLTNHLSAITFFFVMRRRHASFDSTHTENRSTILMSMPTFTSTNNSSNNNNNSIALTHVRLGITTQQHQHPSTHPHPPSSTSLVPTAPLLPPPTPFKILQP